VDGVDAAMLEVIHPDSAAPPLQPLLGMTRQELAHWVAELG